MYAGRRRNTYLNMCEHTKYLDRDNSRVLKFALHPPASPRRPSPFHAAMAASRWMPALALVLGLGPFGFYSVVCQTGGVCKNPSPC